MNNQVFRTNGRGELLRVLETLPDLRPHEVRVSTLAVSLNFRDVVFIKGNQRRPAANYRIPGSDATGSVVQIGSAVTRFKVGDRVCTTVLPNWIDGPLSAAGFEGSLGSANRDGIISQYFHAHETGLVRAPKNLSALEASTLPVAALTAWHAVVELQAIKPGDTVVIQTTGGVAVFAMQFALAMDAKVIVVSRSDLKLKQAANLGVHYLVNTAKTPDWVSEVLKFTSGKGAQLVIDMGLAGNLENSLLAAAFEGTVAIVGVVQVYSNTLDIYSVMNKNLRVRGVETGSRAMFERMINFFEVCSIKPVVDSVFAIDRVEDALNKIERSPFGKVVLDFKAMA